MINDIKLEICISNIDDALILKDYPVDRIELVSAIEIGGLTPSLNTLKKIKDNLDIPVCCMSRCRGGNYIHSSLEIETMYEDAKILLENGADGIVFGFLNKDNSINIEATEKMVKLIKSFQKEAVFHRAFDSTIDLKETSKILEKLGIDRVLTNGKQTKDNIIEGAKIVSDLMKTSNLQYLFGGGVDENNIKDIILNSTINQIHGTFKVYQDDTYRLDKNKLNRAINNLKV